MKLHVHPACRKPWLMTELRLPKRVGKKDRHICLGSKPLPDGQTAIVVPHQAGALG